MGDRDEKKKQLGDELANAVAQGVLAAGTAALSGAAPTPGKDIALAGVAGLLSGLFAPLWQRWRLPRQQKMLTGYAPNEIEEEVVRRIGEAAARNDENLSTIVEVLKSVDEAIDPEVLPVLGKLLRSYTDADRPFDAFARGFSRFLRDLDRGDVEELQECWVRLVPVVKDLRSDPAGFRRLTLVEEDPGFVKVMNYGAAMRLTGAKRLFTSLVNHGLGEENYGGVGEAASVRLLFDVIDRIAPFLA